MTIRVGLTYDLRDDYRAEGFDDEQTAEFDRADTLAAIERALAELGLRPLRVGNLRALVAALHAGERWDLVFNIAEGAYGFGREAQVPALLDAYRIPYTFADPLACAVTLHKATAKHVVRGHGVPTPAFCVVADEAALARVELPYPLFVKPVAEGSSKGVGRASRVDDPARLRETCLRLLRQFDQPVLVETYLPGREFTVGVVGAGDGARTLGVLEIQLRDGADAGGYTYDNKERYETRVDYRLLDAGSVLAASLGGVALDAWRALGGRDAGRVDLRLDAVGRAHFLELNPLPGLNPVRSDLPILCRLAGIGYRELIRYIVDAALRRAALPTTAETTARSARVAAGAV